MFYWIPLGFHWGFHWDSIGLPLGFHCERRKQRMFTVSSTEDICFTKKWIVCSRFIGKSLSWNETALAHEGQRRRTTTCSEHPEVSWQPYNHGQYLTLDFYRCVPSPFPPLSMLMSHAFTMRGGASHKHVLGANIDVRGTGGGVKQKSVSSQLHSQNFFRPRGHSFS